MTRPLQALCVLAVFAAAVALAACNRRIEPFDPNEQPKQPDLSRIFPAGEKQAETQPMLPAAPGGGGGGGSDEPVRGTVSLAEGFDTKVPAGSVLFLIARTGGGGGPPLAVKRIPSPHFPYDFEIGPDDRMIKALPFQGPMRLSARVDADGNATSREPGDLQGTAPGTYEPGDRGVSLVIDEVL